MHQRLRSTPKTSSSARSSDSPPQRVPSSSDLESYPDRQDRPDPRAAAMAQQERDLTRLNQIIQNFHTKAALTICSSRVNLPRATTKTGEIKQNRWFNLILDDTDEYLDDVQEWRRSDLSENRPVPLAVELYIDTAGLIPGQALVITDEDGKHYNIADTLESSKRLSSGSTHEVVLERWVVQLGDAEGLTSTQLGDQLPNVYKKGVVLFRSLFSFLRLLPAWKLHRRISRQTGSNHALRIKFRIKKIPQGRSARNAKENAFVPLCPSDTEADSVGKHNFEPLFCPAGPLYIGVQYRINCNFSVEDSEAFLSSKFAGIDQALYDRQYGRSLPSERSQTSDNMDRQSDAPRRVKLAGGGAYGSLGTFHAAGKRESPVTVLRQRAMSQDEEGEPVKRDGIIRRQSHVGDSDLLRNPPFKAGSYVSSPRPLASPSSSLPKASPFGTSAPKRLSLNTLPQQALRAPGSEQAIASSGSASPRAAPVHRYSSSFANRKRFTSTGSKTGESNTSSGHGSESSKDRSGQLNDGNVGSSGSGRTDEDDIAAFIVSVEKAKDMAAFTARKPPGSNTINLNKFKGMGIASSELADEMSTSSLIQTSLTPPSRRLSNVPGLSTSSSPGRALAHAPHVRSRLSTHSIAEEKEKPGQPSRIAGADGADEEEDSDEEPFIFQQDNIL